MYIAATDGMFRKSTSTLATTPSVPALNALIVAFRGRSHICRGVSNNSFSATISAGTSKRPRPNDPATANSRGTKMKEHDVLDPASAAEAEMAAAAHQCLVAALDRSKAEHIKVILDFAESEPGRMRLSWNSLRERCDSLLKCSGKWRSASPCY
ncbi:hypothetical protein ABL840_20245 [Variovorax sp. NFACC27]|uniref:hypothetical protein n=2 Tax=Variovorax TaxID=34072 RepID=UPI00277F1E3B|nr:hypothetical protein [Variovorax paradoxus]